MLQEIDGIVGNHVVELALILAMSHTVQQDVPLQIDWVAIYMSLYDE